MTSVGRTQLETALRALGELLEARGLHYEVVLIGGGNLILRGLVTHDPSPGYRSLLADTLRQLGLEDADASLG